MGIGDASVSVFPIDKPVYCVILRAYRMGPVAIGKDWLAGCAMCGFGQGAFQEKRHASYQDSDRTSVVAWKGRSEFPRGSRA